MHSGQRINGDSLRVTGGGVHHGAVMTSHGLVAHRYGGEDRRWDPRQCVLKRICGRVHLTQSAHARAFTAQQCRTNNREILGFLRDRSSTLGFPANHSVLAGTADELREFMPGLYRTNLLLLLLLIRPRRAVESQE